MKISIAPFLGALATLACLPTTVQAGWQDDYSQLLGKYASAQGVKYGTWKNNASDMQALDAVADAIASEKPSGSRDEKLAWYLNAYNALILDEMLDQYPKDNNNALRRNSFFSSKNITVAGEQMSFNRLEHEIIRPTFNEPRIHFALNCASVSCPPLLDEAFQASTLDSVLTNQTRTFLSDPSRGVKVVGSTAYVSELFTWFSEDFGDTQDYINQYRSEPIPGKIRKLNWNWALNDVK